MENWYTGYSDLACWIPIVPPSLIPPAQSPRKESAPDMATSSDSQEPAVEAAGV